MAKQRAMGARLQARLGLAGSGSPHVRFVEADRESWEDCRGALYASRLLLVLNAFLTAVYALEGKYRLLANTVTFSLFTDCPQLLLALQRASLTRRLAVLRWSYRLSVVVPILLHPTLPPDVVADEVLVRRMMFARLVGWLLVFESLEDAPVFGIVALSLSLHANSSMALQVAASGGIVVLVPTVLLGLRERVYVALAKSAKGAAAPSRIGGARVFAGAAAMVAPIAAMVAPLGSQSAPSPDLSRLRVVVAALVVALSGGILAVARYSSFGRALAEDDALVAAESRPDGPLPFPVTERVRGRGVMWVVGTATMVVTAALTLRWVSVLVAAARDPALGPWTALVALGVSGAVGALGVSAVKAFRRAAHPAGIRRGVSPAREGWPNRYSQAMYFAHFALGAANVVASAGGPGRGQSDAAPLLLCAVWTATPWRCARPWRPCCLRTWRSPAPSSPLSGRATPCWLRAS